VFQEDKSAATVAGLLHGVLGDVATGELETEPRLKLDYPSGKAIGWSAKTCGVDDIGR
jgi:hypothetical protein